MPNVTLGSYGALGSVLTTELNALAAGALSAASSEIDNTSALAIFETLELLVTIPTTPVAGEVVELYILESVDGTNFGDGSGSVQPPDTALVGIFPVRAVAGAQRITLVDPVPLKPGKYKYLLKNNTSDAFDATGNTLKRRAYSLTTSA